MPPTLLPAPVATALQPLFSALPATKAMARLVVATPPTDEHAALVQRALADPALKSSPALAAGLWLYIDDLNSSHRISQQHEDDPTFCYWHAIMHRREGDFSNSGHWFRRTGDHPVIKTIAVTAGGEEPYDPFAFVKLVEKAHRAGEAPAELVEFQRREWAALFGWCAAAG
jgi:hypothetical protein